MLGYRKTVRALKIQREGSFGSNALCGLEIAAFAIAQSNFDVKKKAIKFVRAIGVHVSPDDVTAWFGRMAT